MQPGCYDIWTEVWIGWFSLVPQIIWPPTESVEKHLNRKRTFVCCKVSLSP